jgi:hypothetical protein
MLIAHVALAAKDAPQVVVDVKSFALDPPMLMLLIDKDPLPEFFKLSVSFAEAKPKVSGPKERLLGVICKFGVLAEPPEKLCDTLCTALATSVALATMVWLPALKEEGLMTAWYNHFRSEEKVVLVS